MLEPKWLTLAKQRLGVAEIVGVKNNPTVVGWLKRFGSWINDDETAWCAAFMNSMLLDAGFRSTQKPLAARGVEQSTNFRKLPGPRYGCIVSLHAGDPKKWQGHTGFLLGISSDAKRIRLLGGNQGNRVSESWFPTSRVTGYWWPMQRVDGTPVIDLPDMPPVLRDDGSPVPTDR